LKLIGRNGEELGNEMRISKTISNDKNGDGLEKELESMKAFKYVGGEEGQNIEHKHEKR
jgi:hypothetical protein